MGTHASGGAPPDDKEGVLDADSQIALLADGSCRPQLALYGIRYPRFNVITLRTYTTAVLLYTHALTATFMFASSKEVISHNITTYPRVTKMINHQ